MKQEQINKLYLEKRRKKLTNIELANAIGCSPSLLSRYFNHQCNLSSYKEQKLIQLIHQAKEYRYMKVEID